jgi:hypothetical protein
MQLNHLPAEIQYYISTFCIPERGFRDELSTFILMLPQLRSYLRNNKEYRKDLKEKFFYVEIIGPNKYHKEFHTTKKFNGISHGKYFIFYNNTMCENGKYASNKKDGIISIYNTRGELKEAYYYNKLSYLGDGTGESYKQFLKECKLRVPHCEQNGEKRVTKY